MLFKYYIIIFLVVQFASKIFRLMKLSDKHFVIIFIIKLALINGLILINFVRLADNHLN